MLQEEAKAVTAVADCAGKGIEASRGLGAWVARVLGTLPEDAVGLLGDWVSEVRTRNADRLHRRTEEILASRNAEIEPLSLSIARPLFEAAQDESRDELVEMWARLLANAMDKSRPPIRKAFIEALKRLDPLDAVILDCTHRKSPRGWVKHDLWPNDLAVSVDELAVSLAHLKDVGCLDLMTNIHDEGLHRISPFGRELMRACSV
jgi:hypothetical protein